MTELIVLLHLQRLCVGVHPLQETHCGGGEWACSGLRGVHPAPVWCGVGQWEGLVPNSMCSPPLHPLGMLLLHIPPDPGRSSGGSWQQQDNIGSVLRVNFLHLKNSPSLPEMDFLINGKYFLTKPISNPNDRPMRCCSVEENSQHKKQAVGVWCHKSSGPPLLTRRWCCAWRRWHHAVQW